MINLMGIFSFVNNKSLIPNNADIIKINQKIELIYERIKIIEHIEENVKFYFSIYWTITTLAIATIGVVIGVIAWIGFKEIKRRIQEQVILEVAKEITELKNNANMFRYDEGKKYLRGNEIESKRCVITIGSSEMNFDFADKNMIKVTPIQGNDKLGYEAVVQNGELIINLKNFDHVKHGGILWRIVHFN